MVIERRNAVRDDAIPLTEPNNYNLGVKAEQRRQYKDDI
jgi:hypothetical protein